MVDQAQPNPTHQRLLWHFRGIQSYSRLEAYKAIPDWQHTDLSHNSEEYVLLDHGYDENKAKELFTLEDMQRAAAFRGGKCLGYANDQSPISDSQYPITDSQYPITDSEALWDTPLNWECAEGHRFTATPRLVLLGGHWCPECMPYPYANKANARPWQWDKVAKKNPFFAQLWAPLHDANEDNVYGPEVFDGWEK